MTKRHSTKRALIASLLVLALCFTSLIGTTFAWFTDSVTSSGNIIKTGTLDVEMYWADGTMAVPADDAGWTDASTGAIFDYNNWEPGYVQVRHIKISNVGSLALKYKVQIVANGVVSDLSDVIDVYYVDPAVQVADRTALTENMKLGTLTDVLAALGETGNGTLDAGKADTITIALKMQETAGNEYQDKSIGSSFAVQLLATQLASENDSFNNQYDADAEYPEIFVGAIDKSAGQPARVVAENFSIDIPSEADEGFYTLEINYKDGGVDANGKFNLNVDIDLEKDGTKIENGVEYAVNAYIGLARTDIAITHNGVSVDNFVYSAESGMVSFTVNSFSPFGFTFNSNPDGMMAVATERYGIPYYYMSLDEALEAVAENGTLKLLATTYIDETVVLTKNITFDMNNKTLRANAALCTDPMVNVLSDVVILNGKMKSDDHAACYGFVVGDETTAGNLTISDGTYQTSESAVYVANGSANISGGKFLASTSYSVQKLVDGTNVSITGGNYFYSADPAEYVADGYTSSTYQGYAGGLKEYHVGKSVISTEVNGEVYYDCYLASAIQYRIPEGSSGRVTILEDQEIDGNKLYNGSPINAYNKNVVLDLNGKTVTFDYSKQTDKNATASSTTYTSIYVSKGAFTIVDSGENGTIYNKEHSAGDNTDRRYNRILWAGIDADVIIEGGRFISELRDAMFYTTASGSSTKTTTLEIKGGYFEQINKQESGAGAVGYVFFNKNNSYSGLQSVVISGGTFKTHPLAGWYGDNTAEATIANGYVVEVVDGGYTVVEQSGN